MEQSPQGRYHGTKPARVQQHSQTYAFFLGSPVWGQELDSMMPVGPFQQGIFSGSILLFCENAN